MKNTLFFSQLDLHKFFMYSNIIMYITIYIHWCITFQLECRGEQGVSFELGKEIEKDLFILSQAEDKENTLSPHEESNLRPLDSVHRCSTTEPQGSVMLKLCSRNC